MERTGKLVLSHVDKVIVVANAFVVTLNRCGLWTDARTEADWLGLVNCVYGLVNVCKWSGDYKAHLLGEEAWRWQRIALMVHHFADIFVGNFSEIV